MAYERAVSAATAAEYRQIVGEAVLNTAITQGNSGLLSNRRGRKLRRCNRQNLPKVAHR